MSVGLTVIDRFTASTLGFLEARAALGSGGGAGSGSIGAAGGALQVTLGELFASYNPAELRSTPVPRTDLYGRARAVPPPGWTALTAWRLCLHRVPL